MKQTTLAANRQLALERIGVTVERIADALDITDYAPITYIPGNFPNDLKQLRMLENVDAFLDQVAAAVAPEPVEVKTAVKPAAKTTTKKGKG